MGPLIAEGYASYKIQMLPHRAAFVFISALITGLNNQEGTIPVRIG